MIDLSTIQIANSFSAIDSLQFLLTKERMDTQHKQYIHRVLKRCQDKSLHAGIADLEGSGKSTAIAEYYHTNENVFYVKVGESYRSKTLLQELVYMVSGSFPPDSFNVFILIKRLSWLLTQDLNRKIIIVDDAGKIKPVGLGHFHELIDNTQSCVSFVFVGLQYFKINLENWKAKNVQGIGEFYRRIESWYDQLPTLTKEEKYRYCKMRGINSVKAINDLSNASNSISQLEFIVGKFLEVGEDNILEKPTSKFKQID